MLKNTSKKQCFMYVHMYALHIIFTQNILVKLKMDDIISNPTVKNKLSFSWNGLYTLNIYEENIWLLNAQKNWNTSWEYCTVILLEFIFSII